MNERRITLRVIESREMPARISGISAPENPSCPESDDYLIVLNEKLNEEEKASAFVHELLHIWHRDHFADNVQRIEAERHAECARLGL